MSEPWNRVQSAADELPGIGDVMWIRAPGRVNLMGDHTDYNDGFCLPVAIEYETRIAVRRADHGRVRVRSITAGVHGGGDRVAEAGVLHDAAAAAVLDPTQNVDDEDIEQQLADMPADGAQAPADATPEWGRYVAGVLRVLADRGVVTPGLEAVLDSTLPPGSGLASSASLEIAVAMAVLATAGERMAVHDLARACQAAEQLAGGLSRGLTDQLASLAGRNSHAMLIDCRSLEVTPVRAPTGLSVLAMHCGVARGPDDTQRAERREACELSAERVGVSALRDARLDQVRGDPIARHVVSENQRVLDLVDALGADDREAMGRLMGESHVSLRDDYEVSTPELDALVESLLKAGAVGARLTGVGAGGCAVALVDHDRAGQVAAEAAILYAERTGYMAAAFPTRFADGAGPV